MAPARSRWYEVSPSVRGSVQPRKWELVTLALALASGPGCKEKSDPVARATAQAPDAAPPDPALPGLGAGNTDLEAELAAALAAKGADYEARTDHKHADGAPKYTNRLIRQTSPYLLQHAHNPVNWHPWGDEAFDRAGREGKPVLLSIGYSTCHWCHVMERESFEDEEIAAYINQNYVPVKVDREERPDVDAVYMSAVQMLTGRGGWPMTLILTPDRQPFFGGTYFPARDGDRGARKGFLTVLRELRERYDEDPVTVVEEAAELSEKLRRSAQGGPPGSVPGADVIAQGVRGLVRSHDATWGGFGRAPKFPRPANLELLFRYARRTGDAASLEVAERTLQKMIEGGIHDHVGGGFHRYATDARWLTPHFEKMLYDNAQLVCALLEAHQITDDTRYSEVARSTLDYLDREMGHAEGGFFSATDADSRNPDGGHDEEGWFFTWTVGELEQALGVEAARRLGAYYGVTKRGNFEGRNVLHTWRPIEDVAAEFGISTEELRAELEKSRALLYAARQGRPPPLRDDKMLTSWNGLAISAFARAGFVLDEPAYVQRAARAADFVLARLRDADGGLLRSYREGIPSHRGYLDDYAFFIQALLDLHDATSDPRWLDAALALQDRLDAGFWDEARGGYFMSAADGEALLTRQKPDYDGAEPSGNSVAALNLLRLGQLRESEEFRAAADRIFAAMSSRLRQSPGAVPKLLTALDRRLDRPLEIFVIAPEDESVPSTLIDAVRGAFVPNRILVITSEADLGKHTRMIPALAGKRALAGRATAFVCEQGICQQPTSDPKVLAKQLERITAYEG